MKYQMGRWFSRPCLYNSIRISSLILELCGVGMIIYSLWLLKKWDHEVSHINVSTYLPRPWFVIICLGVGIGVILSTLCGQIVTNCVNNYLLCIYIVCICTLLLSQVAATVIIFFEIEWDEIIEFIDDSYIDFKNFFIFHLHLCRMIVMVILIPQVSVIVLAIVFWALGNERRTNGNNFNIPDFSRSFLLDS